MSFNKGPYRGDGSRKLARHFFFFFWYFGIFILVKPVHPPITNYETDTSGHLGLAGQWPLRGQGVNIVFRQSLIGFSPNVASPTSTVTSRISLYKSSQQTINSKHTGNPQTICKRRTFKNDKTSVFKVSASAKVNFDNI